MAEHRPQGISLLWPPLPGKAMKAVFFFFFLHPKLCLRLSLGTSGQRPSFGNTTCIYITDIYNSVRHFVVNNIYSFATKSMETS